MQKNYTKNIHIYPVNNKFNKNVLEIQDSNLYIKNISNNQSIYKYFYSQNINNTIDNIFIFNSSIINSEIVDFIQNFSNNLKICILVDVDQDNFDFDLNANYICTKHIPDRKYTLLPEHIVSKSLYGNIQYPYKKDQIVYFLHSNSSSVLDKIQPLLYPNSKLPIKLFDSDKFSHPQNLGYLTEDARQRVLVESKYYLYDSSNYYLAESLLCDCIPINIESSEDIYNQLQNNVCSKPKNIIYYCDFIKEISNG